MGLSTDLISQFVKVTNDEKKVNTPTKINGTAVVQNGKTYVQLDGSELLTPVETTANVKDGERVTVTINNHTATIDGNYSSPAARTEDVEENTSKIEKFEVVMAYKVTTEDLEAVNATIDRLLADVARIDGLQVMEAEINKLQAKYADLEYVSADTADLLEADIENLKASFAEFTNVSAEDMEVINASINELSAYNADFTYVSADKLAAYKAEINQLTAHIIDAETGNFKFATIDFANIDEAAVEKLFTESGIIKDLVVSEGHITGELVGVTISGDLIKANTLKADKLVVLGSDGIYYKLNVNAMGQAAVDKLSSDEKDKLQNGLHGSSIIAKSITAEKVKVDDLVAFGATIGGFNITNNSIYSSTKATVDSSIRGIYFDKDGQISFGDGSNYIRYYKDVNDNWKLEVRAESIKIGASSKSIEEEIQEIKDNVTCNLRIESSRGTVFKNNAISTVLSAVIFRGPDRITDITTLREVMGSTAYLQWKWQRIDDDSFGVISANDSHLSNDGFTYTVSPDEVDTKVTFLCELIV